MSRTTQKQEITKESIEAQVSLYDLISKYTHLKSIGGKYKGFCPVHSEKTPSFTLDTNKNIFKCFGCGFGGNNIFSFVMQKENLDFKQGMEFLSKEFHVDKSLIVKPKQVIPQDDIEIDFDKDKFQPLHKEYYNRLLIPEEFLNKKNIFAVKDFTINRRKFKMEDGWYAFVYDAGDKGCKILLLGENTPWKWRNTVPNSHLWYFDKEKKYEDLWICKSNKDAVCMEYHFGLDSIATQNESHIILLDKNYNRINRAAKRKIVNYGADFQGWHESWLLTYYTDWNYWNTPNYVQEKYDVEDVSDFIDEFGVEPIRQDLIKKGYL